MQEVVILSDDEDEAPVKSQKPKIKSEPFDSAPSNSRPTYSSALPKSSDLIDLTEEALDDTDVPRHYISWLSDLVARAKIKPITVDQRLEVAVISQDIIEIVDDDDTIKPVVDDDDTSKSVVVDSNAINDGMSKVVAHVDSPSNDSGCVIMNREEVGIIHSNSNYDISRRSSETSVDEEEVALNESVARLSGDVTGLAPPAKVHEKNVAVVTNANDSAQATTTSQHVSAGSNSSSCSEPAAEQLLTTVASSVSSHPSCNKYSNETNVKSVASEPLVSTSCTASDADDAAEDSTQASTSTLVLVSTSTLVAPPESPKIDSMAMSSSISRMKQTQSDYVMQDETEMRRDTGIGTRPDDDEDSFLMDVFGAPKPIRLQAKHRVAFTPSKKSSSSPVSSASIIRAVQPERQTYGSDWQPPRDDCVDELQDLSTQTRRLPVSVPLSTIKTSSLHKIRRIDSNTDSDEFNPFFAAIDDGYGNDNEATDDERNDLEVARVRKFSHDRHTSPHPKRTPVQKAPPLTPHSLERSVRFADDVVPNDNDVEDEGAITPPRVRSKYSVSNVEETVPSTIQDRKTYIKKPSPSDKQRNFTPTPMSRLNLIPTARSTTPSSSHRTPIQPAHLFSPMHELPGASPYSKSILHQSSSSSSSTSQQPPSHPSYRVFYSGTELDLGLNEEVESSPLSDTCAPIKDIELTNLPAPSTASAFSESDNKNLMLNTSTSKATTQLPAATVGVGTSHLSKQQPQLNSERLQLASMAATVYAAPNPDGHPGISNAGNADESTELGKMLEIFRELKNRLQIMGYKPEDDASATTSGGVKRLPIKTLETEELYGDAKSLRESSDEIDEGDASLPFKKRRKLPVYSDTMELIKEEEDSDSQPAFEPESPFSIPAVEHEIEISSTSSPPSPPPPPLLPSLPPMQQIPAPPPQASTSQAASVSAVEETQPPIARMECYPSTPMLSIANVVEYFPIRIAPVRFNIVPQPTMVINNTPNQNVMGQPATAPNSNTAHTAAARTLNILPPQPQMNVTGNASIGNPSAQNSNAACGIVGADTEQSYLAPPMQTIASDGSASGFNVAQNAAIQYHRQTFHSNQPYTTTYSIQPTHQNTNNIPSNFDIQNMFNLHNYQMNPQNYHNLVQNSRINLQEKQAILLNDFVHSFDNNNPYENTSHQHQQQQQHHQQQLQMHHMQQAAMAQSTNDAHKKTACGLSANLANRTCTTAPRTKAARKMVSETSAQSSNVTSSSLGEKTATSTSTTKTNRVTRSSNRTTRAAQSTSTAEQKSPRRKANRYK